jgi:hypothetical protein
MTSCVGCAEGRRRRLAMAGGIDGRVRWRWHVECVCRRKERKERKKKKKSVSLLNPRKFVG